MANVTRYSRVCGGGMCKQKTVTSIVITVTIPDNHSSMSLYFSTHSTNSLIVMPPARSKGVSVRC